MLLNNGHKLEKGLNANISGTFVNNSYTVNTSNERENGASD